VLRLRSLAFDVLLYGLMGLMGVLFAPMALWSVAGAYRAVKIYAGTMLWLLGAICGLRTEVRGGVPDGEVIVAAKHQSFLDILILVKVLPRPKFVMKQELRWAPVFGLYAMRIGSTPVNRGARSQAMKDMIAHVEKTGAEARQLVIYPQGTRVLPGSRSPYKVGAGVLYERFANPCVPAATNVGVFWSRRSPYRRPGLAVVEFLPTIPPGLPVAEFMARVEAAVETASDRLMREAGFDPGAGSDALERPANT
jgi:1-acyl-sn-glycerol-3-phosphate acyltransferase